MGNRSCVWAIMVPTCCSLLHTLFPFSYVEFLPGDQCGPSSQSTVLQEQSVPLCVSHEPHLLHRGLLYGLQGNLCPSICSTSSSFFTDLSVFRAVAHTSFLITIFAFVAFLPFLKVPPSWLKGSAVPSGVSGMGAAVASSHKGLPAAPPLKSCHINLFHK